MGTQHVSKILAALLVNKHMTFLSRIDYSYIAAAPFWPIPLEFA